MRYFTIDELCHSDTAIALGIDNTPNSEIKEHLIQLIEELLDPLRIAWGSGIKVTSGYRCARLNRALKGSSPTSAHLIGYASDLVPCNGDISGFKRFAVKWLKENNIKFDQCLCETNGKGKQWLHLGLFNLSMQQRKQILNLKV